MDRTVARGYHRPVRPLARHGIAPADLAIGAVLTALGLLLTLSPPPGSAGEGVWLDTLTVPAVTLPVIWRRRAPLACAAALAAGVVVSGIPTFEQVRCGVAIPAALLIVYALATRAEGRRAIGGLGLVLGGMAILSFTDANLEPSVLLYLIAPLCLVVWAAGRVVRSRNALAAELAERSRALERQRERTARLAVEVEREQLAVQLDAAARRRLREMIELTEHGERLVARQDPEGARRVFARIESGVRASLNEMRDLLGVLRSDEAPARTPQPTLAQLEALIADARSGGRVVDLDVEGERRSLPDGVELAAYRMVQHALRAIDGAEGRATRVRLRYLDDTLELEVGGTLSGKQGTDAALAAARERVAAHGGSFSVLPLQRGRTAVRARLAVAVAHA